MAPNIEYILGIDLGATQLRFILAEKESGNIDFVDGKNSKKSFPSPFSEEEQLFPDSYFALIPDADRVSVYIVHSLEAYLTGLGIVKEAIRGIGISVAGSVHNDGRFIGSNVPLKYAKKINNSYGIDLLTNIHSVFPENVNIIIENDGNCAGVAQGIYYEQMGFDPDKTFFVTVSTGIGGGGPKRDLDEVGHILVDGYFPGLVPLCGCGAHGCIEAYASGEGIRNQAVSIMDMFINNKTVFEEFRIFERIRTRGIYDLHDIVDRSDLKNKHIDGLNIDAKMIFDYANLDKKKDASDRFACYLIETAAERLAKVLYSLSNIHGIELFGIGGSVAINNPGYLNLVRQKIKGLRRSEDIFKSSIEVEISPLGEYVTDYGALLLVVESQHKKNWIDTITSMKEYSNK